MGITSECEFNADSDADPIRLIPTADLAAELQRRGVAPSTDVVLPATLYRDVGEFHKKMLLANADDGPPRRMAWGEYRYRASFMFEELREYCEAFANNDVAGQLDALCDLVWVALGTAQLSRLPFDEAWAEVRRANMQKRPWREGDPIKARAVATSLEVVKPLGWRGPDIAGALEARRDSFDKSRGDER